MTDIHRHRKPCFTADTSRVFRYIKPRPRVILALRAAGDHRGCARPLGIRGGGLDLRTARFGSPVGCFSSSLVQGYHYLQLDDGYLVVVGNKTLCWEWARSCWDGSTRAGGWRCRYIVSVLSRKTSLRT